MKKILFTLSVTIFVAGGILTGCNSPTQKEEKVKETKEAVIITNSDLRLTQNDSLTVFQQFKAEYEKQISANEKRIAEIKKGIVGASKENKAIFNKKLAELEKRNSDLKIKLNDYKEDGTDKWQIFKTEFKSDMDELGKAFSDFTVSENN